MRENATKSAERREDKIKRSQTILQLLNKHYPDAHCALDHSTPLELLVATILSAQCTDERVNKVTPALFKRFKGAKAFASVSAQEIEPFIKSTGFFRSKAKSIQGMAEILVQQHGGEVPKDLDALVKLPGVGRKTANVVLGNAFHMACGIVVDTHVKRLAFRLGLTKQLTPEKVEDDLLKLVPEKDWIQVSHWLIFHGRQVCKARNPACEKCFLLKLCPQKGVTSR